MTDPARDARIDSFLIGAGWGAAQRRALPGDASFRHYVLLEDGARRALMMDAPPGKEDVRPYVFIDRHLRALGYSAPEIFAADPEAGLLVIEHLGDDTYTRLLDGGRDAETLYALAVDVLIDLHRRGAAEALPAGIAPYDEAALLREVLLFTEWYLPEVAGHPTGTAVTEAFVAAWKAVLPPVLAAPPTLVLRDYHVDNLLLVAGRRGIAACGLLDFQDALAGPAAYDLMSLLEDARRDIDPALAAAMLERYRRALPQRDGAAFATVYAILAAQRHMKVIGIFTRLFRRDGKPRYLAHLPRLWRLLQRSLEHPALAPVAGWLATNVPPELRGTPARLGVRP